MNKNVLVNVKVSVTPNNIRTGIQDQTNGCAIGRALGRVIEKRSFGTKVYMEEVIIFNRKTGKTWKCALPKKATRFLTRFDESKTKAKPIDFVLRGVPVDAVCSNVKPMSICQEHLDKESDSCPQKCNSCTGCK